MFELLALLALMAIGGFLALALTLLVLPVVLLFKVLGWGLSVAVRALGVVVGAVVLLPLGLLLVPLGLLLLPVAAFVGGLLLLKLAIVAAPLLLLVGAVWALVALTRRRPVAAA